MFVADLFIIARNKKQSRWSSSEEWVWKMWWIYIVEHYLVVKINNIMNFVGKWIKLEKIIKNEVTQTLKDKHGMY